MKTSPIYSGILLVNKPKDTGSFKVTSLIKRLIKKAVKVGHAGTFRS